MCRRTSDILCKSEMKYSKINSSNRSIFVSESGCVARPNADIICSFTRLFHKIKQKREFDFRDIFHNRQYGTFSCLSLLWTLNGERQTHRQDNLSERIDRELIIWLPFACVRATLMTSISTEIVHWTWFAMPGYILWPFKFWWQAENVIKIILYYQRSIAYKTIQAKNDLFLVISCVIKTERIWLVWPVTGHLMLLKTTKKCRKWLQNHCMLSFGTKRTRNVNFVMWSNASHRTWLPSLTWVWEIEWAMALIFRGVHF